MQYDQDPVSRPSDEVSLPTRSTQLGASIRQSFALAGLSGKEFIPSLGGVRADLVDLVVANLDSPDLVDRAEAHRIVVTFRDESLGISLDPVNSFFRLPMAPEELTTSLVPVIRGIEEPYGEQLRTRFGIFGSPNSHEIAGVAKEYEPKYMNEDARIAGSLAAAALTFAQQAEQAGALIDLKSVWNGLNIAKMAEDVPLPDMYQHHPEASQIAAQALVHSVMLEVTKDMSSVFADQQELKRTAAKELAVL